MFINFFELPWQCSNIAQWKDTSSEHFTLCELFMEIKPLTLVLKDSHVGKREQIE
jgi:hypothetical protein